MWIYKPLTAVDYNYVARLEDRAVLTINVSGDVINSIYVEYDWKPTSPEFDKKEGVRRRDLYRFGRELFFSQQVMGPSGQWVLEPKDPMWECRPAMNVPESWHFALGELKKREPQLEGKVKCCLLKMQAAGPKF